MLISVTSCSYVSPERVLPKVAEHIFCLKIPLKEEQSKLHIFVQEFVVAYYLQYQNDNLSQ